MPQPARPRTSQTASPPQGRRRRAVPAVILTAGMLVATAILLNAAHDAAPPTPYADTTAVTTFGVVARTPDDPANPKPWQPDGR